MLDESTLLDAHITLSETLRDTHYGHTITVYKEPPSPVAFSSAVGNNTPFVVRGAANHWPAVDAKSSHRWTNEYLLRKLGSKDVTVSLTTTGYADSVVWIPEDGRKAEDGMVVLAKDELAEQAKESNIRPNGMGLISGEEGDFFFATPFDIQMPFHKVLAYMTSFGFTPNPCDSETIAFCQLQNDCLRGPEYSSLMADVPDAIPPWAAAVLGTEPEAINFWMGRHESVTSFHSDPYENIYTVIRGAKIFTLYPPCDLFFFHKQEYETAQWLPVKDGQLGSFDIPQVALVASAQEDGEPRPRIPWIPITHPDSPAPDHPRFAHAPESFVVRVNAGDSLYLPRGWLHHVRQDEDEGGVCIAINAWYEGWEGMGLAWGWAEYARKMDEVVRNGE